MCGSVENLPESLQINIGEGSPVWENTSITGKKGYSELKNGIKAAAKWLKLRDVCVCMRESSVNHFIVFSWVCLFFLQSLLEH